jgi:hypothetical protein
VGLPFLFALQHSFFLFNSRFVYHFLLYFFCSCVVEKTHVKSKKCLVPLFLVAKEKNSLYDVFVVEKTHVFPATNFTTIFSNKFMFGKTHVFLTISFPNCGSYFFSLVEKTHVFSTIFPTTLEYSFVFGKTNVFLIISFPDCGSYFFLWLKKLTFFQLFYNNLVIQFCVWKNSSFFNYFVSRLWLGLFLFG